MEHRKVVIIGAGPAGAVAAALLRHQAYDVLVLERQTFPRFSLGESLLPHCMEYLDAAGMLPAVHAAGFQHKNGAAFACGDLYTSIDFREKFSPGPGTTYQVQRAHFDQVLADDAVRQGAEVQYRQEVLTADFDGPHPVLEVRDLDSGEIRKIGADFVLDASGYGRVLARLLELEYPSHLAPRKAIFTHIEDNIDDPGFDREKILITVQPGDRRIWYWLIPFSNGRCSFGVVGEPHLLGPEDAPLNEILRAQADAAPNLKRLFRNAIWDTPVSSIGGYSANVKSLHGRGFALLGNAAEFLDPVFSSGVTIALRSAKLAADALHRQFQGETVDWDADFSRPLTQGVDTFRAYVQGWYDGGFQDVVFHRHAQPEVTRMISAILAGYAWDTHNPYVADPERRLRTLSEICAGSLDSALTS